MNFRTSIGYKLALTIMLSSGIFMISQSTVDAETAAELTEKKAEVDQQIDKLNEEIEKLQQDLQQQVKTFEKTNEKIAATDKEITETTKRIDDRTIIIGDRIVAYQAKDSNMSLYIDAVFGSESLTDIVSRVNTIKTILDADKKLIEEQEQDKKSLTDTKKKLTKLKEEQQALFQKMQEQEEQLQVVIAENKAKSLELKVEIADAKEREALAEQQRQAAEQARALAALQTNFEGQTAATTDSTTTADNTTADNTTADNTATAGAVLSSTGGAISEARKYVGRPYVWGGSNPSTGFDCSGLVQWAYGQAGISLPRTSGAQYLATAKISRSEAKAGDLVFFSYGSGVAHVGIYLGNGTMLDAQNAGVKVESLGWWEQYLVGFGRVQ